MHINEGYLDVDMRNFHYVDDETYFLSPYLDYNLAAVCIYMLECVTVSSNKF